MRWLTELFKPKPPPPAIEHPMLGTLIGSRALNGKVCSWQPASPVDTPIGPLKLDFQAGANGPTNSQIELWQEIVGNLGKLRHEAYPFLNGWLEGLGADVTPEEIQPTEVLIWDEPETMPDWSLQFYLSNRFWRFTVTFENGIASHTDFDSEA